jgi:hypothetical protein
MPAQTRYPLSALATISLSHMLDQHFVYVVLIASMTYGTLINQTIDDFDNSIVYSGSK